LEGYQQYLYSCIHYKEHSPIFIAWTKVCSAATASAFTYKNMKDLKSKKG